jgi:hypothetical protein
MLWFSLSPKALKQMDTLSKSQIESALSARLPSYRVTCSLHADGTLSAVLSGPETDHFAITGIVRAHYRVPKRSPDWPMKFSGRW